MRVSASNNDIKAVSKYIKIYENGWSCPVIIMIMLDKLGAPIIVHNALLSSRNIEWVKLTYDVNDGAM